MSLPFDPVAEAHRNWTAHGWPEPDTMAAATSIVRAHQILLGRVDATLADLGLTFSRFEALALLHFSGRGSLPMGKMGDRLQVHPTSITSTIDKLESDGLVRRKPHPTDRRAVLAEITPAGREAVEAGASLLGDAHFGLGGLDDRGIQGLTEILLTLRREAGDFE